MATSIEENLFSILDTLASGSRDEMGNAWFYGKQIQELTSLSPPEINDAVTFMQESGLVEWHQYPIPPFVFERIMITPKGRYELHRMRLHGKPETDEKRRQAPLTPIGSPYGFRDKDWEAVMKAKSRTQVRVVLGYQFVSEHYDSERLNHNVEEMFQRAIDEYNEITDVEQVSLFFQSLSAGYGEHLFNEIARDIISADIAVFETSDLNPNVMLEMGVALTWGVSVLPIKVEGRPIPPSDISGQTWAEYHDDASRFIDPNHHQKLFRMVERVVRKKHA